MTKVNNLLKFYGEHKISPVRQDISDYKKHKMRREQLYRHLGIFPDYFAGKKVLEAGPGGGFNSLVVADYNPSHYVLVEPNFTGYEHILKNIKDRTQYKEKIIEVFNQKIEDFHSEELFDIVICEGMIHGLNNQEVVLKKLDSFLRSGGMMILTCVDDISYLFEMIKRYFAYELIKDVAEFNEKVNILVDAFKPHYDSLVGRSRLLEDWAVDNFMNPAAFDPLFSVSDCIRFFRKGYQYYNTSPKILTDFRWFKQIPEDPLDNNSIALIEYDSIKHNLIYCRSVSGKRSKDKNDMLESLCKKARELIALHETGKDVRLELRSTLQMIKDNLTDVGGDVITSFSEIDSLLSRKELNVSDVREKYPHFIRSFGRGTVHVSLTKNKEEGSLKL